MKRFQKIKSLVKQIKKSSILNSYNSTIFCGDGTSPKDQSPCTVDSQTGFNLFPVMCMSDQVQEKKQEYEEINLFDDSRLTPLKKQKNSEQVKKKTLNPVSFRVTRKTKDHAYETLANVNQFITKPIGSKIRISQSKTKVCNSVNKTHRSLTITEEQAQFRRHVSIQHKLKTKKERLSPRRLRNRTLGRTRRAISPRKHSSPTKNFVISAWQTPEDFQLLLF